jgi:hypothetical protein
MPSGSEVLGNRSIRGQKSLGMPRRLKPLHAAFPLPRRPMRVLASIIEVTTLAMLYPWENLTFGRTVALQLVRNDDPWHVLYALQQLAEKLLRRLFVASALHQDIEHVVILIHRAPQVMALTVDGQKDFIQVPFIPGLRATPTQAIGIILPKLATPLTDGFMGRSYWIPGSYALALSEKRNSCLRLLTKKDFKEERMTKVGLDAIG